MAQEMHLQKALLLQQLAIKEEHLPKLFYIPMMELPGVLQPLAVLYLLRMHGSLPGMGRSG